MSSFSGFSERAARESRAEISALLSMRDSAPRRHWSDDSDDDAKRPASSQRRRQLSNRRPDSPDRSVYASDQAVVSQRKHKELQHALKASSEKMAALEADLAESRRHASQQLQQLTHEFESARSNVDRHQVEQRRLQHVSERETLVQQRCDRALRAIEQWSTRSAELSRESLCSLLDMWYSEFFVPPASADRNCALFFVNEAMDSSVSAQLSFSAESLTSTVCSSQQISTSLLSLPASAFPSQIASVSSRLLPEISLCVPRSVWHQLSSGLACWTLSDESNSSSQSITLWARFGTFAWLRLVAWLDPQTFTSATSPALAAALTALTRSTALALQSVVTKQQTNKVIAHDRLRLVWEQSRASNITRLLSELRQLPFTTLYSWCTHSGLDTCAPRQGLTLPAVEFHATSLCVTSLTQLCRQFCAALDRMDEAHFAPPPSSITSVSTPALPHSMPREQHIFLPDSMWSSCLPRRDRGDTTESMWSCPLSTQSWIRFHVDSGRFELVKFQRPHLESNIPIIDNLPRHRGQLIDCIPLDERSYGDDNLEEHSSLLFSMIRQPQFTLFLQTCLRSRQPSNMFLTADATKPSHVPGIHAWTDSISISSSIPEFTTQEYGFSVLLVSNTKVDKSIITVDLPHVSEAMKRFAASMSWSLSSWNQQRYLMASHILGWTHALDEMSLLVINERDNHVRDLNAAAATLEDSRALLREEHARSVREHAQTLSEHAAEIERERANFAAGQQTAAAEAATALLAVEQRLAESQMQVEAARAERDAAVARSTEAVELAQTKVSAANTAESELQRFQQIAKAKADAADKIRGVQTQSMAVMCDLIAEQWCSAHVADILKQADLFESNSEHSLWSLDVQAPPLSEICLLLARWIAGSDLVSAVGVASHLWRSTDSLHCLGSLCVSCDSDADRSAVLSGAASTVDQTPSITAVNCAEKMNAQLCESTLQPFAAIPEGAVLHTAFVIDARDIKSAANVSLLLHIEIRLSDATADTDMVLEELSRVLMPLRQMLRVCAFNLTLFQRCLQLDAQSRRSQRATVSSALKQHRHQSETNVAEQAARAKFQRDAAAMFASICGSAPDSNFKFIIQALAQAPHGVIDSVTASQALEVRRAAIASVLLHYQGSSSLLQILQSTDSQARQNPLLRVARTVCSAMQHALSVPTETSFTVKLALQSNAIVQLVSGMSIGINESEDSIIDAAELKSIAHNAAKAIVDMTKTDRLSIGATTGGPDWLLFSADNQLDTLERIGAEASVQHRDLIVRHDADEHGSHRVVVAIPLLLDDQVAGVLIATRTSKGRSTTEAAVQFESPFLSAPQLCARKAPPHRLTAPVASGAATALTWSEWSLLLSLTHAAAAVLPPSSLSKFTASARLSQEHKLAVGLVRRQQESETKLILVQHSADIAAQLGSCLQFEACLSAINQHASHLQFRARLWMLHDNGLMPTYSNKQQQLVTGDAIKPIDTVLHTMFDSQYDVSQPLLIRQPSIQCRSDPFYSSTTDQSSVVVLLLDQSRRFGALELLGSHEIMQTVLASATLLAHSLASALLRCRAFEQSAQVCAKLQSEVDEHVTLMSSDIAAVTAERARMSKRLEDLEQSLTRSQEDLRRAEDRFVNAAAAQQQSDNRASKLAHKNDDLQADLQAARAQLTTLRAECDQARAQVQSLSRRLDISVPAASFMELNDKQSQAIDRLTQENQALVKMLNELVAAMQSNEQDK